MAICSKTAAALGTLASPLAMLGSEHSQRWEVNNCQWPDKAMGEPRQLHPGDHENILLTLPSTG